MQDNVVVLLCFDTPTRFNCASFRKDVLVEICRQAQRLWMAGVMRWGSRHSKIHCTGWLAVSKIRRKKAWASGVKSSAPSIHKKSGSWLRTCWCKLSRPSLRVLSVLAFQWNNFLRAAFTWPRIHVVFPHPGGPYTNQAGWGIPFNTVLKGLFR